MYIRAASTVTLHPDIKETQIPTVFEGKHYSFHLSGNDALKCFLQDKIKKSGRIAIQYFTCHTVVDTIREMGYDVVFMDISPLFFSSPLSEVRRVIDDFDVDIIIITHLFGIPNPQRVEIGELAKIKAIPIIDDLCQTMKASLNGEYLESISDAFFYSFYIDKPVGYFNGGVLCVKESLISNSIIEGYNNDLVLKRLEVVIKYLKSKKYRPHFNPYSKLTQFLLTMDMYINTKFVEFCIFSPLTIFAARVFDKIFGCKREYQLNRVLCNSILKSIEEFDPKERLVVLKRAMSSYDLVCPYLEISNISCSIGSRSAILSKNQKRTITMMRKDGYEVGLDNWPFEYVPDSLPNTKIVIDHLVNIPTWGEQLYLT